MKENLRKQWNDACLQAGIPSISIHKSAKIMAVLMVHGNNEAMVLNPHFVADVLYIQEKFHLRGGETPNGLFAEYLKEYVADLQEADHQGFIPQWAEKLFMQDYEIKLYR